MTPKLYFAPFCREKLTIADQSCTPSPDILETPFTSGGLHMMTAIESVEFIAPIKSATIGLVEQPS